MKYWLVIHDFSVFKNHPDLIGLTVRKDSKTNEFIRKADGSYMPRFEHYNGVIIDPKIGDKVAYYCPKRDYKIIIGLFEIIEGPNKFIDDWETPIQYKIKELTLVNSDSYIPYSEMVDNLELFKDKTTGEQFTGRSAGNKIHGPIRPINSRDFNWIYNRYTRIEGEFQKAADYAEPLETTDIDVNIQRRIDDIRIKQAEFEGAKQEFLMDYKNLNQLRKQFVRKFPIKDILSMSLKDYVVGFGDKDSFCYWLETKLMPLGKIKGGTTADKKFSVYYSKSKKKYLTIPKFSDTVEEAFIKIKNEINDLLIAGKDKDIDTIKKNEISPMFKGKILANYYPENYLNIFSKAHLEYFLDKLEIHYDESHDRIDKRMLLLDYKSNDEIMKEWNNFIFMKFLYKAFGQPARANDIQSGLNEYNDTLDEYPDMKNVRPKSIDLSIIPKISEPSKSTKSFKGKIDFERENKIKYNLGKRGELIVMKLETDFLQKNNLNDLVNKLDRVSLVNDSLGYDIISYDENGKKKFIEVKATTNSPSLNVNFIISSNQLKVAKETDNYYFYIVFNAKSVNPKVWKLKNPIKYKEKGMTLTPINCRVTINTDY
ncbi:MAG: DUF3883 domain-containing protein [Candidatus Heimdallarchaeota archaeon]